MGARGTSSQGPMETRNHATGAGACGCTAGYRDERTGSNRRARAGARRASPPRDQTCPTTRQARHAQVPERTCGRTVAARDGQVYGPRPSVERTSTSLEEHPTGSHAGGPPAEVDGTVPRSPMTRGPRTTDLPHRGLTRTTRPGRRTIHSCGYVCGYVVRCSPATRRADEVTMRGALRVRPATPHTCARNGEESRCHSPRRSISRPFGTRASTT